MRVLEELYYSIFVLSLRANAWDDKNIRIGLGLQGVTTVQAVLFFTLSEWVEFFLNREVVALWMIILGYVLLLCGNNWILCKRGAGILFEQQFDGLPKTKRAMLLSAAITTVIAVFAFCIWSIGLYRAKFHPA